MEKGSKRRSILILDDREFGKIHEVFLHQAGYQVFMCKEPAAALGIARATQPDLIHMGFWHFLGDAVPIATALRQELDLAGDPIILVHNFDHNTPDEITNEYPIFTTSISRHVGTAAYVDFINSVVP
jgi:DNA-binding response OmpR family regulator